MNHEKKYISHTDFHNGDQFIKINKQIDSCLTLIKKLILFNDKCKTEVANIKNVDSYIIDYRINQFGYYDNTLKSIYYSCYSLKYVFDISTYMNLNDIGNTIGETLENQRKYITFNAIVKLYSIFEYTRGVFEKEIPTTKYFDNLKKKYGAKADSLLLLRDFRHTVHSNGKWDMEKKKGDLRYFLREGEQVLKSGDVFKYDHWKLYTMIKDCLELSKLMALDNEATKVRQTKIKVNGQNVVSVKTEMTLKDWDNLFDQNKLK